MADPALTISAASSLGRNYATLNATITSNGTTRTWWDGINPSDGSDATTSRSDTEYFFEFLNASGTPIVQLPLVRGEAGIEAWENTIDYPSVTDHVEAIAASDPITVTQIAYMLTPGGIYYVRFCAWRILYPGSGNGERYRRENQPHKLFFTAPVTFTLPTT